MEEEYLLYTQEGHRNVARSKTHPSGFLPLCVEHHCVCALYATGRESRTSSSPLPSPFQSAGCIWNWPCSEGKAELTHSKAMHQGVLRDVEQQRLKKERQLDFEMQRALEEEYRKVQSVHDGGEAVEKGR